MRRSPLAGVVFSLALLLPALIAVVLFFSPLETQVARGKTAAIPLSDTLTPEQQLAQELALADNRVQAYTAGQRTEVFGVAQFLDINTPISALGCRVDNCRVVNIFNFDESATIQAFVRLDTRDVVEVYHQPGLRPGINRRLADRAMEIALNEPSVIEIIGEQRASADWAPMDTSVVGTACETGHMCVAPTFNMGDYILWAVVDLTDDTFVKTFWTGTDGNAAATTPYPDAYAAGVGGTAMGGCPASGSVNRNGWQLDYNTTPSDGFRVSNVRYNGQLVITSAKLAEWHADYGNSGYQDAAGCGGGGGGFPINPFGETQTYDLLSPDGSTVIGFAVEQDFRMGNWGGTCSYRYDQTFEFYADGRFRTVQGAYGKGCGQNSLYRGLMRIDLAVGGTPENDNIATWNGTDWQAVTNETLWCPEGEMNATCVGLVPGSNADGYRWRLLDSQTESGFYIEPGRGQFGDNGRGDNEFMYVTNYYANQGDDDMGTFSAGCCNNYRHGPEVYMEVIPATNPPTPDPEVITDANLVLWYVPQQQTQVPGQGQTPSYDNTYCWTIQGGSNPITFPCYSGPMFVPFGNEMEPAPPNAAFTFPNEPYFATNAPIQFTDTSTAGIPASMTYAWTFGDGGTSTDANPSHAYTTAGTYSVTLTLDNGFYRDTYAANVVVEADVEVEIQLPAPEPGGFYFVGEPIQFTADASEGVNPNALTYAWTFGTGDTSIEQNPIYTYTQAGDYEVTVTAGNGFFTETASALLRLEEEQEPPTAVTLGELESATNNTLLLYGLLTGVALVAGVVILRRRSFL